MSANQDPRRGGGGGVPVQQAVSAAILYFQSLFQQPTADLTVEEVERADIDRYWLITLGYSLQRTSFAAIGSAGRQYKVVKIDAQTGEPVSMKIRKL